MDSITIELLIMLFFLILKGLFSGSEIAMVNSDKLKLRHKAKQGNRGAYLVLQLFKVPDILLGTTLIGTNIATVIITTMASLIFIDLFGRSGDIISIIILTPFLLILGEIVPKSIFQQKADDLVCYLIYVLRFFSTLFYPLLFIFSRIARFAARWVGGNAQQKNVFITREELRTLLDISDSSIASSIDRRRIRRIMRFGDTTVGEAMIPLAEVVGFNESRGMGEALRLVWQYGYNRLPVYRSNITNVKGILTIDTWDLMEQDIGEKAVTDYIVEPLYLSPKQTIDRALPKLKARDDHMAIVVDEFGSAIGILTLEDVFEEVVGELTSSYDFEEYQPRKRILFEKQNEDLYLVGGRMPLSEINDILHINLPVSEAHTIGGLISNRLRHIPLANDQLEEQQYRFTVLEADARSVQKVRIERI